MEINRPKAKSDNYHNKFKDNLKSMKHLFQAADVMLGKVKCVASSYSYNVSYHESEQPNRFVDLFFEKVLNIRTHLDELNNDSNDFGFDWCLFETFRSVSEKVIKGLIEKKSNVCETM